MQLGSHCQINAIAQCCCPSIGHPPYLADLLQYHKTTKSTQSSASHLLSVTWHNLSFGSRAFHISAPKTWNSLPPHILQSQTLDSFGRHLKTYYFQYGLSCPLAPVPNASWFSSETLALYKSLTYLQSYRLYHYSPYNTRQGRTGVASFPKISLICSTGLTQITSVMDRQTDRQSCHRMYYACTMHTMVKNCICYHSSAELLKPKRNWCQSKWQTINDPETRHTWVTNEQQVWFTTNSCPRLIQPLTNT